jgi:hypothetical protein
MKTQNGSIVLIGLVSALILFIGLYLYLTGIQKDNSTFVDENNPAQIAFQNNSQIKIAMESFKNVLATRKQEGVTGLFCTGGFINETESDLAKISQSIIRNRILNFSPMEYARTQDEAGITCLGSAEEWVLFSALNKQSEDDQKNYWCVDSRGVRGAYGYNSETNQCLNEEPL